jgi:hypothetical protein
MDDPKSLQELKAHYLAVKKRLGGVAGGTGVVAPAVVFRAPEPDAEPEKPVDAFMFDIKVPRYKFVQMLRDVAHMHGVDPQIVLSPCAKRDIVVVRHEVQYKARNDLGMTLTQIGRIFNRDHTTVLNAVRSHQKKIDAKAHHA